jgi:NAD(P)-dependent dehydrogenase (short-subunit alcohol dehydrogenase family)
MNNGARKALLLGAAGLGTYLAVRGAVRSARWIDLRGRTALVTGGSRGLGLVIARQLAERGARLAICSREPDELQRASDDIAARGAEVVAVACDVTDRGQVETMVRTVLDRFGAIDILINNAGTIQVGPFEVTTVEDYELALRTHFWAPLYTTLAVYPRMRRRGLGRIVNISSIGGKVSTPHLLPYCASKFALAGFSEGLRAELAGDGILVTTVIPGLMRTGSPRNALFKGQHRAEYAWFSISDSLPILSIGAEAAARKIISACQHGDAELILSLPAQLAIRFHGLFPGLTVELMSLANRLLPDAGGIGTRSFPGRESTSALSPSWATTLTEKAARRNNEIAESETPSPRPQAGLA